jgi:hypothetical protein
MSGETGSSATDQRPPSAAPDAERQHPEPEPRQRPSAAHPLELGQQRRHVGEATRRVARRPALQRATQATGHAAKLRRRRDDPREHLLLERPYSATQKLN